MHNFSNELVREVFIHVLNLFVSYLLLTLAMVSSSYISLNLRFEGLLINFSLLGSRLPLLEQVQIWVGCRLLLLLFVETNLFGRLFLVLSGTLARLPSMPIRILFHTLRFFLVGIELIGILSHKFNNLIILFL